jgi:hypothetical protein
MALVVSVLNSVQWAVHQLPLKTVSDFRCAQSLLYENFVQWAVYQLRLKTVSDFRCAQSLLYENFVQWAVCQLRLKTASDFRCAQRLLYEKFWCHQITCICNTTTEVINKHTEEQRPEDRSLRNTVEHIKMCWMNIMNLNTRITVSYVTVQLTDITVTVHKHWA